MYADRTRAAGTHPAHPRREWNEAKALWTRSLFDDQLRGTYDSDPRHAKPQFAKRVQDPGAIAGLGATAALVGRVES